MKTPSSPPFMAALSPEPLPGSSGLAFLPFIRLPEGWAAWLLFTERYQSSRQSWGALEVALAVSRMSVRNLAQPRVRFYDPGSSLAVKKKKKKTCRFGSSCQPPAPLSADVFLNVLNVCSVVLCRHMLPDCV